MGDAISFAFTNLLSRNNQRNILIPLKKEAVINV
jgi:hypothetical protein